MQLAGCHNTASICKETAEESRLALSVSACASSPQRLILGRWETESDKITAEFGKDVATRFTILGQTVHGTYRLKARDELEWTPNGRSTKHKVNVNSTTGTNRRSECDDHVQEKVNKTATVSGCTGLMKPLVTISWRKNDNMKATFTILVAVCVALSMSACGSSPQSLIRGRWEAENTPVKLTAEFGRDGKGKMSVLGQTIYGTYEVKDNELQWTVGNITATHKIKTLTATDLELTDGANHTVKYKRK